MSIFGGPSLPAPPPPPPNPSTLAQQSLIEQGAASARQQAASGQGQGTVGTDVTGGQGAASPTNTTSQKALLGG